MPDLERIREPLRSSIERQAKKAGSIVVRLRPTDTRGRDAARKWVHQRIEQLQQQADPGGEPSMGLYRAMADPNQPYVFAHLRGEAIKALVQDDTEWIDYVAEDRSAFDPENLVKTIISEPLLSPTLDSPHTMSA